MPKKKPSAKLVSALAEASETIALFQKFRRLDRLAKELGVTYRVRKTIRPRGRPQSGQLQLLDAVIVRMHDHLKMTHDAIAARLNSGHIKIADFELPRDNQQTGRCWDAGAIGKRYNRATRRAARHNSA